jgi:hypothetical protein
MSDERMNGAIDEVARQMTEGAPTDAAAFRRRVLARIAANEAPRRTWRSVFVLTPLAAAIVIAVVVSRPAGPKGPAPQTHEAVGRPGPSGPGVQPPATDAAGPNGPALPAAVTVRGSGPSGPGVSGRPGPSGPGVSVLSRRPDPSGPGVSATALRATGDTLDPLTVAPLTVDALTPDPIQIERMEIVASIAVAPLGIIDIQRRDE